MHPGMKPEHYEGIEKTQFEAIPTPFYDSKQLYEMGARDIVGMTTEEL